METAYMKALERAQNSIDTALGIGAIRREIDAWEALCGQNGWHSGVALVWGGDERSKPMAKICINVGREEKRA